MRIEIWSDIACPWCLVGKANLDAALAEFAHAEEVEVVWRSFELDPGAPPRREGPYRELLARKYGTSPAGAQGMIDRMVATGAVAGVELDFERIQPGNTFDAHRLVHLGQAHGLQTQVKARLLRAYLSEGERISDHDTLIRLTAEAGLPEERAREVLAGEEYAEAVRADEAAAMALQVTGVPFFLIEGRVAIPGAQPPHVMLRLLERARELTRPQVEILDLSENGALGGIECGPEGCEVPSR